MSRLSTFQRTLQDAVGRNITTNPQTGGEYRVAIRGQRPGDNFCSCPDFAVAMIGTFNHLLTVV